ncbi:unnamed protein product [Rhodiola kirilowii]
MAAMSMAMMIPVACAAQKEALFKALPLKLSKAGGVAGAKLRSGRVVVRASMKEKLAAGVTAGLIAASTVIPVAEAASGVSPSLKNFLLSIAAGSTVLLGIIGAVIGVSNFDPVKRN